jgi:hypothetical protein
MNSVLLLCPPLTKEAKGAYFDKQTFSELLRGGFKALTSVDKRNALPELSRLSLLQTPYRALRYGLNKTFNTPALRNNLPKDLLGSAITTNLGAEGYEHHTGKEVPWRDRLLYSLAGAGVPTLGRFGKNSLVGGATFAQATKKISDSGMFPMSYKSIDDVYNLSNLLSNSNLGLKDKALILAPRLKLLKNLIMGDNENALGVFYVDKKIQLPIALKNSIKTLSKDFNFKRLDTGAVVNKGIESLQKGVMSVGDRNFSDELLDPNSSLNAMLRRGGIEKIRGVAAGPNQQGGHIPFDMPLVPRKKGQGVVKSDDIDDIPEVALPAN